MMNKNLRQKLERIANDLFNKISKNAKSGKNLNLQKIIGDGLNVMNSLSSDDADLIKLHTPIFMEIYFKVCMDHLGLPPPEIASLFRSSGFSPFGPIPPLEHDCAICKNEDCEDRRCEIGFSDGECKNDLGDEGELSATEDMLAEVMEFDEEIIIILDMPGIEKSEVIIEHDDECITVSTPYSDYKNYYKSVKISDGYDRERVKARYTNGILELKLKKL